MCVCGGGGGEEFVGTYQKSDNRLLTATSADERNAIGGDDSARGDFISLDICTGQTPTELQHVLCVSNRE